jgi:hypothetical protein
MTYLDKCLPYLYERGEISVLDVHRISGTTCGHKVIQQLVTKRLIDEGEWQTSTNGKRFKIHKLIENQMRLI